MQNVRDDRGVAHPARGAFGATGEIYNLLTSVALVLRDAWAQHVASHNLARLGEAGLKDIGVSACSIERTVRHGRD